MASAQQAKFMKTCDSPTVYHYEIRQELQYEIEQSRYAALSNNMDEVCQRLEKARDIFDELQVLDDVDDFLQEIHPQLKNLLTLLEQRYDYVKNGWSPSSELIKS